MDNEDIIRMAREAGLEIGVEFIAGHKTNIERFAALVAAHAKSDQINLAYQQGYEEGSAHEREACAKVCEDYAAELDQDKSYWDAAAMNCAAAIRSRSS